MKVNIGILKAQGWHGTIMILVIAGIIFLPTVWYPGVAGSEQIKCRSLCCTKFIRSIGVVNKHEGGDEERILHSRTCELLENTDSHDYLFCDSLELALSKGFVKCESCNLEVVDNDPCTAKCCKYYGWIIEPMSGVLHRKDCRLMHIVKVRFYHDLAFICSRHNTEEELLKKALVERKANYRVCNSCFRQVTPRIYKLQPGLSKYDEGGEFEFDLEAVKICLITMHRFN